MVPVIFVFVKNTSFDRGAYYFRNGIATQANTFAEQQCNLICPFTVVTSLIHSLVQFNDYRKSCQAKLRLDQIKLFVQRYIKWKIINPVL